MIAWEHGNRQGKGQGSARSSSSLPRWWALKLAAILQEDRVREAACLELVFFHFEVKVCIVFEVFGSAANRDHHTNGLGGEGRLNCLH